MIKSSEGDVGLLFEFDWLFRDPVRNEKRILSFLEDNGWTLLQQSRSHGMELVFEACSRGATLAIVKTIYKLRISNSSEKTPLSWAMEASAPLEIVEFLLSKETKKVSGLLNQLRCYNYANIQIAKMLLDYFPEDVYTLIGPARDTLVHRAINRRNLFPDDDALLATNASVVKMLINAWPESLTTTNNGGRTPLFVLLMSDDRDVDLVEYLLERGAVALNMTNENYPPEYPLKWIFQDHSTLTSKAIALFSGKEIFLGELEFNESTMKQFITGLSRNDTIEKVVLAPFVDFQRNSLEILFAGLRPIRELVLEFRNQGTVDLISRFLKKRPNHVQRLHLISSSPESTSMSTFCDALQDNKCLTSLSFDCDELSEENIQALTLLISRNSTLHSLSLQHGVGHDPTPLLDALRESNTSLVNMELSVGNSLCNEFYFYAKLNQRGRGRVRHGTAKDDLIPVLEELLVETDDEEKLGLLYGFLRDVPHLWSTTGSSKIVKS